MTNVKHITQFTFNASAGEASVFSRNAFWRILDALKTALEMNAACKPEVIGSVEYTSSRARWVHALCNLETEVSRFERAHKGVPGTLPLCAAVGCLKQILDSEDYDLATLMEPIYDLVAVRNSLSSQSEDAALLKSALPMFQLLARALAIPSRELIDAA